jgi:hypothetical protein
VLVVLYMLPLFKVPPLHILWIIEYIMPRLIEGGDL